MADGAGGAIIAWNDSRPGVPNYDIYVQHLKSTGVVDPAWPADGRALCSAANEQSMMRLVSDGAGGAIATWIDFRDGVGYHIYAQRVLASGAVDPAWPSDGIPVCVAETGQFAPAIVADGAGGAIIVWQDFRNGDFDIYAQHVLSSGIQDPAWAVDGRPLALAPGNQQRPQIVSDGSGGAIVAWYDGRNVGNDIYAQHVLANGTLDPLNDPNGAAVCLATNNQLLPQLAADGAGGALVTWQDLRNGTDYDVYATRLLSTGAPDPGWPGNGVALCVAANDQNGQVIASDGSGGAIVGWVDSRGTDVDIYAQRVLSNGGVVSVPGGTSVAGLEMPPPFPNPARGRSVEIPIVLPAPSRASIEVFDPAGHRVRALALDRELPTGRQLFEWDGRNETLERQPAGVYFVRIRAGAASMTRRMILLE